MEATETLFPEHDPAALEAAAHQDAPDAPDALDDAEPVELIDIYERHSAAAVRKALVTLMQSMDSATGSAPAHRPELGRCWLWTGPTRETGKGYGSIWVPKNQETGERGKTWYTHRFSYAALVEPIPVDLTVDHICREPRCVNPRHLELATRSENSRNDHGLGTMPAGRTHCPANHPYDDENTYIKPATQFKGPSRVCRTCAREHARAAAELRRLEAYDPDQMTLFDEPTVSA